MPYRAAGGAAGGDDRLLTAFAAGSYPWNPTRMGFLETAIVADDPCQPERSAISGLEAGGGDFRTRISGQTAGDVAG
jgi:hypothetical protein